MSSVFARLRPHAPVLAGLFAFATTGCVYQERPVDGLTVGRQIALQLTDAGVADMAPRLGQGAFLVAGQLERVDSTSIQMSVSKTESTQGALDNLHPLYVSWGGADVTIPRGDIASVREQHVSAPLVVLISAATIATIVSTVVIIQHSQAKLPMPTLPSPPVFP